MKNKIKRLIIGAVIIIILIPVTIFLYGLISTVDIKKSKELADWSNAKTMSIYIPSGYTLLKQAEKLETKLGTLYITTLNKSDKTIEVIQSDKANLTCKGTEKQFGEQKTCFFGIGDRPTDPNNILITWSYDRHDYQLQTNDEGLTDEDITNIIKSCRRN